MERLEIKAIYHWQTIPFSRIIRKNKDANNQGTWNVLIKIIIKNDTQIMKIN